MFLGVVVVYDPCQQSWEKCQLKIYVYICYTILKFLWLFLCVLLKRFSTSSIYFIGQVFFFLLIMDRDVSTVSFIISFYTPEHLCSRKTFLKDTLLMYYLVYLTSSLVDYSNENICTLYLFYSVHYWLCNQYSLGPWLSLTSKLGYLALNFYNPICLLMLQDHTVWFLFII